MKTVIVFCPLLLCLGTAAYAGPPYVTDDPAPPEPGKWEVYAYTEGEHLHGATEGEAGLDINYGAAEDLQLTAGIPLAFELSDNDQSDFGDIELAVKYKFIHQNDGTLVPDIAFYPAMTVPTGSKNVSSGKVGAFFPLWAQKDLGNWSMFGGGGYAINPGEGNKDYWLTGFAVTRQVTDRLNVGAEVYHQTADEIGGKATTGLGFGMEYELTEKWAILASAGPHLTNRDAAGDYTFYISLAFAN